MPLVAVRQLKPGDDLSGLTELIRAAYAPHVATGLRFWGTHQTEEDTAQRFASGQGFVAEMDGTIVGTITVKAPQPDSPVSLYRMPDVWSFSQFAVAPAHKGRGVGVALHENVLLHARSSGAYRMALDTAAPADTLIAMYRAWGYKECGQCDWRPHTNYLSVLMVRNIRGVPDNAL